MINKNVANAVTNPQTEEPASGGKVLRERFKEITGLYESRRRMGPELPVEDICRQIFDHLIPAMHFPVMASAVIELDGRRFTSGNFREGSTHQLQSNIAVLDRLWGHLRVFYPDNTSFLLPEEQELVDAIARDLERWLKEVNCLYEIRRGAESGIAVGGCLPANFGTPDTGAAIPGIRYRRDRTRRQAICYLEPKARFYTRATLED